MSAASAVGNVEVDSSEVLPGTLNDQDLTFQFYLVMKGQGKELEEPTPVIKSQISKFNKRKGNFQHASNGSSQGLDQLHMSEKDINVSI